MCEQVHMARSCRGPRRRMKPAISKQLVCRNHSLRYNGRVLSSILRTWEKTSEYTQLTIMSPHVESLEEIGLHSGIHTRATDSLQVSSLYLWGCTTLAIGSWTLNSRPWLPHLENEKQQLPHCGSQEPWSSAQGAFQTER